MPVRKGSVPGSKLDFIALFIVDISVEVCPRSPWYLNVAENLAPRVGLCSGEPGLVLIGTVRF